MWFTLYDAMILAIGIVEVRSTSGCYVSGLRPKVRDRYEMMKHYWEPISDFDVQVY